jgi:uncharacterized membrane protein
MPKKPPGGRARADLIRSITTPLGFFVLALLIVEVTLGIVLSNSSLPPQYVWPGFLWMVGIFIGVVLVVVGLTIFSPKNLLYGKEEYLSPPLDPSALNDAIADLIVENVKSDCLKNPPL